MISDRAYIFDNSYSKPSFIAEKGDNTIENNMDFVPEWYQKYVIVRTES